jgi:hypothetical protein
MAIARAYRGEQSNVLEENARHRIDLQALIEEGGRL